MSSKEEVATQFGVSLDNDDFELTGRLLSNDCVYDIGSDLIKGRKDICASYKENMIAGRKKLDVLEWGKSRIEPINDHEFIVHFTDYLTHKGNRFTHRCQQRLRINDEGLIKSIDHIDDPQEQKKLDSFYRSVGIIQ